MPSKAGARWSRDSREKYFETYSFTPGPIYSPTDTISSRKARSPSPSFSKGYRDTGFIIKTPFQGTYYDSPTSGVSSREPTFDFIYLYNIYILLVILLYY